MAPRCICFPNSLLRIRLGFQLYESKGHANGLWNQL
ncbi:Protein of unknown function [Pyronema omphalodes CBS 100304]|uniref:Uncharacterized protein n=1 Tax=Pyronema omphalodes (strain CBS 100304) TaxID=1076935 RepID=U4LNE8_PYROM|nr:Protein of unknown function [Pyronema omphalodes CBS 100304]